MITIVITVTTRKLITITITEGTLNSDYKYYYNYYDYAIAEKFGVMANLRLPITTGPIPG